MATGGDISVTSENDEEKDYEMVIAIDFGTTFSGYAFSSTERPSEIIMYKYWGKDVQIPITFKAPTCVLITEEREFEAFGYEAQHKYSNLDPEDDKTYHFFENFKMKLREKPLTRATRIKSKDGYEHNAQDIFAMVLRYMKAHVLQQLKSQTGRNMLNSSIRWVLTVPTIWSDASKQFMREAACKAGLTEDDYSRQLIIALEPEAASLFCRDNYEEKPQGAGTEIKITEGTQYVLIDCGGGTVDVTAHELLPGKKIKEIHKATGSDLGGVKVDQAFMELLFQIFGEDVMESLKTKYQSDWLDLCIKIERAKHSVDPVSTGNTNLHLTYQFGENYQGTAHKSLNQCVPAEFKSKGVVFSNGVLRIPFHIMEGLFKEVVDDVIMLVGTLLKQPALRDVSHLLLVGGFSESPLVQGAIKREFGDKYRILIPNDANLCVAKGAVMFGHSPGAIVNRVARATYGYGWAARFDPTIHDLLHRTVKEGREYVRDAFQKIITKGDMIKQGSVHKHTFPPMSKEQGIMFFDIYRTDLLDAEYIDTGRMEKCGELEITLPTTGTHRSIELEFKFGETEIEVKARDPRPGGEVVMTTLNFLS